MSPFKRRDILISGVQFDQELRSGAMSVLELAPMAARLGTQGVEYREVYWKDKERELPALRRQLEDLGLRCTYATFTTFYSWGEEQQRQLLQDLEDARALGAPLMRVFRGDPPETGAGGEAVLATAEELLRRAERYGMRLALENHIGKFGCKLADVKSTLERFDRLVLGTNVDTSNYPMNGQDTVEAIKALAPKVIYAHLKDVRETPDGPKATYLGNGTLPFAEILAALDATGNDFPLCFEFGGEGDGERAIRESLAYLRSL